MTDHSKYQLSMATATAIAQCEICDNDFYVRWTDTHGVTACCHCGAPYRTIHYDENNKTIEKPAELCIKAEYIPVLRRYVSETKRQFPSGYNLPGSNYEFCSSEDAEFFSAWMEEHADAMLSTEAPA